MVRLNITELTVYYDNNINSIWLQQAYKQHKTIADNWANEKYCNKIKIEWCCKLGCSKVYFSKTSLGKSLQMGYLDSEEELSRKSWSLFW